MLHWNIHSWRDDAGMPNHAAVAGLIRDTAPDVVSLVEVRESWGAPSALGGLADELEYYWVFVPALEFGGSDAQVWVISTHLPASDAGDRARALSRFAVLLRKLDGPWLACGDFNTRPSGWLDELPGVTFCPNPPEATHPARRAVRPIDYCLASPGVRAEARVLRTAGSDHRPVLVSAEPSRSGRG